MSSPMVKSSITITPKKKVRAWNKCLEELAKLEEQVNQAEARTSQKRKNAINTQDAGWIAFYLKSGTPNQNQNQTIWPTKKQSKTQNKPEPEIIILDDSEDEEPARKKMATPQNKKAVSNLPIIQPETDEELPPADLWGALSPSITKEPAHNNMVTQPNKEVVAKIPIIQPVTEQLPSTDLGALSPSIKQPVADDQVMSLVASEIVPVTKDAFPFVEEPKQPQVVNEASKKALKLCQGRYLPEFVKQAAKLRKNRTRYSDTIDFCETAAFEIRKNGMVNLCFDELGVQPLVEDLVGSLLNFEMTISLFTNSADYIAKYFEKFLEILPKPPRWSHPPAKGIHWFDTYQACICLIIQNEMKPFVFSEFPWVDEDEINSMISNCLDSYWQRGICIMG